MAPGRGGSSVADPRNISDRGFKRQAVEKLIQYLADHGFEKVVTQQMLQAPSVRDFVHIISFLLKATVPNFEFGNRARPPRPRPPRRAPVLA